MAARATSRSIQTGPTAIIAAHRPLLLLLSDMITYYLAAATYNHKASFLKMALKQASNQLLLICNNDSVPPPQTWAWTWSIPVFSFDLCYAMLCFAFGSCCIALHALDSRSIILVVAFHSISCPTFRSYCFFWMCRERALYLRKAHAWPTWTNKSQQQSKSNRKAAAAASHDGRHATKQAPSTISTATSLIKPGRMRVPFGDVVKTKLIIQPLAGCMDLCGLFLNLLI